MDVCPSLQRRPKHRTSELYLRGGDRAVLQGTQWHTLSVTHFLGACCVLPSAARVQAGFHRVCHV